MIGRYTLAAVAILLMLQFPAAAFAGDVARRPDKSRAPIAEDARALVRAPLQHLGESYKSIAEVVGQPLSTKFENVPNRHQPSQVDRIKTITYGGLVIRTYEVSTGEKEMLLSVRMTTNRPDILPVLVGMDEKTIRTKYGEPRYMKPNAYTYVLDDPDETGEDSVTIEFANSIVVAVEWSYYVD